MVLPTALMVAALLLATFPVGSLQWLTLIAPAGAAASAAVCFWSTRRRFVFSAAGFYFACAAVFVFATGSEDKSLVQVMLTLLLFVCFLATTTTAAICLLFRRLSPLKISLATWLLSFGAVAALLTNGRTNSPGAVEWSTGFAQKHPDLEYIYNPYAVIKTYYPTNPRGYLDEEPLPEQIDLSIGQLRAQNGAAGVLRPLTDSRGVRVQIQSVGGRLPQDLLVARDCPELLQGKEYRLSFYAKAHRPRSMLVVLVQAHESWQTVAPAQAAALTTQWRQFLVAFPCQKDESRAELQFQLGADLSWVEIKDVIWASPDGPIPQSPARKYSISHRLNSAGFRDEERASAPPKGVFRIACLGDSFTFGQGVKAADVFTSRLQAALNERSRGRPKFEVLNFGVCGYSTRQERVLFELKASKYRPEVVLLTMVDNDNLSYQDEQTLKLADHEAADDATIQTVQRLRRIQSDEDYSGCVKEVLQLNGECRMVGAKLAVVVFRMNPIRWRHRLTDAMVEGLDAAGIPLMDLGETLHSGHLPHELHVHEVDGHPNELAHEIAARTILQFLDAHRLVPAPPMQEAPPKRGP
jgi:hypothetical protein